MARITDQNKVERLKQSTMKLVVEYGFGGASAALIAKDAKVASGYFYMHYKGKYEMVNAILQEVYLEVFSKFDELIKEDTPFGKIIEKMVRHFVDIANSEPIKVKFLYVLTNDYNFVIDNDLRQKNLRFIETIRTVGINSGSLDKQLTVEDLYLILFIMTTQFINQKYKYAEQEQITEDDTSHLLNLFLKILK
ncbi:TetR/AcrR family transcriptional regulator [Gaoshiqia sediminis]|uniref:TetR/AcrR family transcriptional regulator n=1 Tax=Gaoshiqia sediminis TaxID=2986998 RepID=A0AA41YAU3_9BACT|nr:TetR/AcrR family transcriptional regulator [Gaoshiqia sediminis]MCW0484597.1 TetR/AcrR family transcriptional regulator [Gaoshiqia sediminis]